MVINKDGGEKWDDFKPDFSLMDAEFLFSLATVLTHGAKKYGRENWRRVERERYIAAAFRHLTCLLAGEAIDEDTGQHHAAHLSCNAMFLHWLDHQP